MSATLVCVICFENLSNDKDILTIIGCGHVFHKECLTQTLENCNRCPNCRRIVDSTQRLFLPFEENDDNNCVTMPQQSIVQDLKFEATSSENKAIATFQPTDDFCKPQQPLITLEFSSIPVTPQHNATSCASSSDTTACAINYEDGASANYLDSMLERETMVTLENEIERQKRIESLMEKEQQKVVEQQINIESVLTRQEKEVQRILEIELERERKLEEKIQKELEIRKEMEKKMLYSPMKQASKEKNKESCALQ